jgi:hypothetical protein
MPAYRRPITFFGQQMISTWNAQCASNENDEEQDALRKLSTKTLSETEYD